MTILLVSMLTAIVTESKNISDLLLVIRRNEDQFPGTTVDCSTRLFTDFLLLLRAPASSSEIHTRPRQCLVWSHGEAVMWNSAKSISCILLEGFDSTRWQHARWQLQHHQEWFKYSFPSGTVGNIPLRAPICESDGGKVWFSCWMNWSWSLLQTWQAMYSLEKRYQLFFKVEIYCCLPDFP